MAERGRRVAAALCTLLVFIAASGCTRIDPGATSNGLHSWTQPDRLRLASTEEPDSLNKLFANSDASDQVANLISAPIFRWSRRLASSSILKYASISVLFLKAVP